RIFDAQPTTMNKFIASACTIALLFACNTAPTDALAQDKTVKSYGDKITTDGAMSTADFMKAMDKTDSMAVKLDCEIITSCTRKGCWMDVKLPNGEAMKVRFKDYGFFVPTKGLEGKRAVMQGYATKEVTDVATLRHYADDAGKSKEEIEKITEPETNLMFLADGVLITF
ncbi:MAG TPA: DUF4920 domain-containing protein, partial [Flavobacteriales bacterium]|nr:DUF4920 domain-containing protein [Flavobacteriales bacterium]